MCLNLSRPKFLRHSSNNLASTVGVRRLIGHVPNQTEWFDITIEPDVIKPSTYNVSAVFRSRDKSNVQKFTEGFISNISKLIEVIESA